MEDLYDKDTGLPLDEAYLECGLPPYLQHDIDVMKHTLMEMEAGRKPSLWDCDYCSLQSSINCAEINGEITEKQAWYLREKYLGIRRDDL